MGGSARTTKRSSEKEATTTMNVVSMEFEFDTTIFLNDGFEINYYVSI